MRRPFAPHPFSMTWRDGLFVHWPYEPERVRPLVPEPLELDTRGGRAWVGVLPFVLARAGGRFTPSFARLTLRELNVRTYVRLDGDPGLYFLDIDVDRPAVAALVRGLTRLPVNRARVDRWREGDRTRVRSIRVADPGARFAVSYRPTGAPSRAEPGSLDHWLVERRRMYAPEEEGVLYGEIAHEPWPLQTAEATVEENTLLAARGLPAPGSDPHVGYAGELPMTGSVFRRLDR